VAVAALVAESGPGYGSIARKIAESTGHLAPEKVWVAGIAGRGSPVLLELPLGLLPGLAIHKYRNRYGNPLILRPQFPSRVFESPITSSLFLVSRWNGSSLVVVGNTSIGFVAEDMVNGTLSPGGAS